MHRPDKALPLPRCRRGSTCSHRSPAAGPRSTPARSRERRCPFSASLCQACWYRLTRARTHSRTQTRSVCISVRASGRRVHRNPLNTQFHGPRCTNTLTPAQRTPPPPPNTGLLKQTREKSPSSVGSDPSSSGSHTFSKGSISSAVKGCVVELSATLQVWCPIHALVNTFHLIEWEQLARISHLRGGSYLCILVNCREWVVAEASLL
jgi:hypothetical protein